jgi:protocatechuate 3,4-dioxygenase beta subunit
MILNPKWKKQRFPPTALSVIVIVFAAAGARSAPQEGAKNPGTIVGRVVDRSTGARVSQVLVSLTGRGTGAVASRVRTSATGQFVFSGLAPGQWALRASGPGWSSGRDASRSVGVKAGELVTDVQLTLDRSVAIGGAATDDRGDSVVGIDVRLLGVSPEGSWTSVGSTETDDRGRYRFFNRAPGSYLVMMPFTQVTMAAGSERSPLPAGDAAIKAAPGPDGRNNLYATTFHPSARNAAEAQVVTISSGVERSDVDINIRPVPATSISGLLLADGGPPAPSKVRLVVRGASFTPDVAITTSAPRGEFDFSLVPAGSYDIVVEPEPVRELATQPSTWWTRHAIQVGANAISNLRVPLSRGRTVSGRIELRGTRPQPTPEQFQRAQVTLRRIDSQALYRGPVNADRTFEVRNLPGGLYQVAALNVSGWPLISAIHEGRDIADMPVDLVPSDIADAVLTLTDVYPELRGTVRAKGAIEGGATVLLFPADRKPWTEFIHTSRRIREAVSLQDGSYSLANLPPGEYFILAVRSQIAAWRRTEVLENLARSATRVNVPEQRTVEQDVALVQIGGGRSNRPVSPDAGGAPQSSAPPTIRDHGPFVPDAEPSGQDLPASRINSGVVSGRVLQAADESAGVRGATVTLSADAGSWVTTTLTDDAGAFVFDQVPPGRYRVSAAKAAYLSMQFGARSPGRPGSSFVLAPRSRMEMAIVLPRGAVITGIVTDALGAPLATARVRVLRAVDRQGTTHVEPAAAARPGEAVTDDRGEYRVYGLPPGRFYVGATPGIGGLGTPARQVDDRDVQAHIGVAAAPRPSAPPQSRERDISPPTPIVYASVFHPRAKRLVDALPVDLELQEERTAVNIQMELVPSVAFSGRIFGPDGLPARAGVISLRPAGAYVPTEFWGVSREGTGAGGSLGGYVQARATGDGRFTINALTPGIYDVVAGGTPATEDRSVSRPSWWAMDSVTIGGKDLGDYSITLRPASTVAGVLRGQGTERAVAADGFRLSLVPAVRDELSAEVLLPQIAKDGTFRFDAVPPGVHRLRVDSPTGLVAHSAMLDGRDLLDEPLQLFSGQAVEGLAVNVSDRLAILDGVFTDEAGRPASDYFVVVFPVNSSLWEERSRRIRALRPGTDGRFEAAGLPAGEYFIAAVWDVEPDEWYKASFLDQLVRNAVKVTLTDGMRTTQHLRVSGGARYR